MPLFRISDQSKVSLLEFYEDFANYEGWKDIAVSMIEFIRKIDELFIETQIWGLTSHARLALLAKDQWYSECFVLVNCIAMNQFEVLIGLHAKKDDCLSFVKTSASLEDAIKHTLVAMSESGGWLECDELEKLVKGVEFE